MTATATTYENIELVIQDNVATITIARPKVMNALNNALLRELDNALDVVKASDEARVLVITGSGDKAFVAGADINELAKMQPMEAKDLAAFGQSVFRKVEELGIPSIAMVNGFALGGGMELALSCSLRTASTSARLGLPEVSLGIIPGYGGTQRLSRIAGPGVAREWVLLGDIFTAEEAHRVGVINRVFAPEDLVEGTMKMVKTMLSRGPIALRLALEAIGRGGNMSQREGETIECDMFGLASTTDDMREGMTAFIEKRRANFQGK